MAVIVEKTEDEQEQAIGYDCIYCYGTHRIKLEFDIKTGLWKIIPLETYDDGEKLESVFDDIQFLTLDQQIQIIIKRFDQHFLGELKTKYSFSRLGCDCLEIDQIKNESYQMSMPTSIFKEEDGMKCNNRELIPLQQIPTSTTILEDDEQPQKDIVDYGFHGLITGSRSKFSGLAPPPVAPRRSRQNSACSTQSSVRYAS